MFGLRFAKLRDHFGEIPLVEAVKIAGAEGETILSEPRLLLVGCREGGFVDHAVVEIEDVVEEERIGQKEALVTLPVEPVTLPDPVDVVERLEERGRSRRRSGRR